MEPIPSHEAKKGYVKPYIPASQSLPEITIKGFILGVILSAVLAGANAYLGLKVGMTVSASIPAAVISMTVLRFFRQSNILENNIVQTTASAGEALAAGVIFTLPALVMLQYWDGFPFVPTMAISLVGGVLGVLFTIPLRRALVTEMGLKFPEGVATGEVLKAGTTGGAGARSLTLAGLGAAFLKLGQTGLKIFTPAVSGSVTAGSSVFGLGNDLGVALLGVGYIVGVNVGIVVVAGGIISWIFGIPIYMAVTDPAALAAIVGDSTGYEAATAVWGARIRYMGVGSMAVGGVWAIISLMKPIKDGIVSSLAAVRQRKEGEGASIPRTERDVPFNLVAMGTLALAIPMFVIFLYIVDQETLQITSDLYWITVIIGVLFSLVAGFLFSSVAGYMAGLIGSSNNPISGVTIATILTISLILLVVLGSQVDFTINAEQATTAAATAILVGGVVACAAAIAGDNLQDLKAGQVVGATPWKQQFMLIVGVAAAAVVIAPILGLLFQAYGLGDLLPRPGMDPNEALAAPQAALMSSVANGVFRRDLPWTMIAIGSVISVFVILLDNYLERRESSFRTPVLAVAVGIYLPIEVTVPIFIGGSIAWLVDRNLLSRREQFSRSFDEIRAESSNRGLLFASGLITGEALVGILLAIPFAFYESTDVWRILPEGMETVSTILGVGAYILFAYWLYRTARKVA